MTTIIANDVPPAARGLLRRWFIEPRPNVFVGSVNARTREKTLAYIRRNAPGLAMLVIFAFFPTL
jgi:CRISPR-associated protein Cas2